MIDFTNNLKQRFDWAVYVSLEAYEVLSHGKSFVRSDERERAIDLFENLHDSVDAVPPPLIRSSEALRDAVPDLFEKTLLHGLRVVGRDGFFPTARPSLSKYSTELLNATARCGCRPFAFP
jgi:hypothetical protein